APRQLRRCRSHLMRRRQAAPGFDGEFRFLDILQKGGLGVVAPPAAALEHFGKIVQPLLGQRAPARDDLAAGRLVSAMCHEPARKKKERTQTRTHESTRM